MQNKSLSRAAADVLLLHLGGGGGNQLLRFYFASEIPASRCGLLICSQRTRLKGQIDLHAEPRFLQEQFSRNCEPDAAQTPIVA